MVVNSCSGIINIVQLIEVQEIRKNLFFLHFQINIIIIDIWDFYERGYYWTLPLLAGIVSVISNDPRTQRWHWNRTYTVLALSLIHI